MFHYAHLLTALFFASVLLGSPAATAEPEAAAPDARLGVADQMGLMKHNLRRLARSVRAGAFGAEAPAQIAAALAAAQACQALLPPGVTDTDTDKLTDYRRRMAEVVATLTALQTAIEQADVEAATTLMTQLDSQEEQGHKVFRVDE